jgi:hypothetical protein
MPDLLDQISEQRDLLDVIDEKPYDPSGPPLHPRPEDKPLVGPETTEKVLGLFKKSFWSGLGIISWPFQRIEYTLATPLTTALEARKKTLAEDGIDKGFGIIQPRLLQTEDAVREYKEVVGILGTVGKSWIPGKKAPEGVKTFNDFFSSYYEGLTGEPAEEWYKIISGGGASVLIVPYLFGKILKGIAAGAKATKIPQTIAARRLPAWQQMKRLARLETGARITNAQDLGKSLSNKEIRHLANLLSKRTGRTVTPRAVKLRLTQIIKGGVTTQPELAAKANPVIEEFARMSGELKKLGILPEHTYISRLPKKAVANLLREKAKLQKQLERLKTAPHYVGTREISGSFPGKAAKVKELETKIKNISSSLEQHYHLGGEQYFPRMYMSQEEAQAAKKFPLYSKERIRAQFAKQRKKIPEDVRKAMGEIREPAYPVVKRMIQESSAIETAKLFEFAASNPKWVSDKWLPGFVKQALPDTKAYGALRGKFVHPTIQKDVTALLRTKSDIEALYDAGMGTWKLGKTVWNPAVHSRNMFSNSVLLDLSGMDHIQQVKYTAKALKHIKENSQEYQAARKYFMRTTMVKGELLDDMLKGFKEVDSGGGLRSFINALNRNVSKASATPSQLYQAEEFTGKFIKFLQQRAQGKTVMEAVQEANKWLFDYSDLSTWEKNIARRIMPFYTFPRKALPRVLEAAANRPLALAKYPMLAKSLTQYSLYKLNLTTKDYEQIQKLLPEYMSKGSYLLMPYRDANGDLRFFDWTWNVPWGGLFEAEQRGLLKSTVTNPLLTLTFDIMNNKSSWTGRKIYDDAIPVDKQTPAYRKEQNFKKMLYVWQALSPSLMYKGIYWDKLYGAATGKKLRGKDMLLPEAIAHTIFGVRTQAFDEDEARRWQLLRMAEGFDELRGNMLKILTQRSNGDINEQEFDKKWGIYTEQLQKYHLDAITEEEDGPTTEELLGVIEEMMENPEGLEEQKKE